MKRSEIHPPKEPEAHDDDRYQKGEVAQQTERESNVADHAQNGE
jgi:hypothetical protein